jgi:hypothetical protein
MTRAIFSLLALGLGLGFLSGAAAHHPAKMERCESFAFTGQVERIEWRRPHVELFIRTDAGVTHQVTWLAINQLEVAGISRDTLRIGDQVIVIAGVRPNDVVERPMLLSYIHRDSDGWGWTERPQGC